MEKASEAANTKHPEGSIRQTRKLSDIQDIAENNHAYLLEELRRLDLVLHIQALRSRQRDRQNEHDPSGFDSFSMEEFKGLVVSEDEVDSLLSGELGSAQDHDSPALDAPEIQGLVDELGEFETEIHGKRNASLEQGAYLSLPHLSHLFRLTAFEEQVILLCLAPELDRKYERIYAYLQNDITQKKPGVDFALSMLCASSEEKTAERRVFSPDGALMKYGILQFNSESREEKSSLLSRPLKLDDRIVNFILGTRQLDDRIRPFAQLLQPQTAWEEAQIGEELKGKLMDLTARCFQRSGESDEKLIYLFQGDYGTGKKTAAEALCGELGLQLVVADVAGMINGNMPFGEAAWLLFRESLLLPAAIYLDGFDGIIEAEQKAGYLSAMVRAFDAFSLLTFLDSETPWEPVGEFKGHFFMTVDFTIPDYSVRKSWWDAALASEEFHASPELDTGALANKFRISGGQIRDSLVKARNLALWRDPEKGQIQMTDLYDACRAKSNQTLGRLTQKLNPKYTWDDIVLSQDRLDQLVEMCNQARYRHIVYGEWGFDRKLSFGKGLSALFSGPPGTGKTMAAEVIANKLHLDLYKIDLSQVVSKYIGETEKNLHKIFREAQGSNAILFFDEADALFGKRSEVKDAHDRYANIEIGYLLQKIEEYDGIAILATNLRKNMDEAFVRRLQFIVEFPFPDEEHRQLIWEVIFPQEVPFCDDVDFGFLAREVKLPGGNIKNIALAGAFYAASDGGAVKMTHLIHAARREHQKLGQMWGDRWSVDS